MSRSTRALVWTALGALLLLVGSIAVGATAANSVVTTRADDSSRAATPNDLKPSACSGITVTAKVTGSGAINGTNVAELITGSAVADSITARGGNDCVLGGAGDDTLNGGGGTDVCIGGAGTNTYANCETII
jgi:Ca2+-binding RTX toxin-like protein